MTNKQRYAIIGTGALGGLYGGMLARNGHEVHFLLHSDYEHVQKHGLRVDTVWGDFHLRQVNAHGSPNTIPQCDVTIVALKTTQNHLLPELLPASTGNTGVVLVLQNGLDVEVDAVAVVGNNRVLGGCCFLCSNKIGPGYIRHIDYGRIVFGVYGDAKAKVGDKLLSDIGNEICRDLNASGVDTKFSDDLPMVRWRKLMWNIPFNGLSVLLDASTKEIMENEHAAQLAESIIREVHSAADACGVHVDESTIEITLQNTRDMVPYDSSMRLDAIANRPMEIESIMGAPIRSANEVGRKMPRVEMMYQQLKYRQPTAPKTVST